MIEDREKIEGPLSLEQCRKALDTFEGDKTPGGYGFTVEFYKTFFDLIGQDLMNFPHHNEEELSLLYQRKMVRY